MPKAQDLILSAGFISYLNENIQKRLSRFAGRERIDEKSMTTLKIVKQIIPSASLGGESTLPPIAIKLSLSDITNAFYLDEDDGLFINYGIMESVYPYRYQDLYDRDLNPTEYDAAVIENECLKATFMPCFGGKLWSLIDKRTGKELLFRNDVIRPCNLGVRNAWLSGGIEWNACFKGHNPFTCSLINTARTQLADGTPVLRFYYFERIRAAVVQMDFFLPEKSELLYARMRVTNPTDKVIPMYWWSNVAAEEKPGDRVIVPATKSYTAPNNDVVKINIPVHNGIDVSYPAENITSNDYFWTTEKDVRPYMCQLDSEGYGICQVSTSLLKGRKLFVWGNSQGGHKWMNFLTADDKSGRYDEIQAGLAHTQYESLPMPPHTVWEWLEGYGAMQADKEKVHGAWLGAREEVERRFDKLISQEKLEKMLADTREMAKSPAELLFHMDGWGALELKRRKRVGENLMNPHLDFGETDREQTDWIRLMNEGTIGIHDKDEVPASYMRQKEWLDMLEKAIAGKDSRNWYAYYLLGTAAIAEENYEKAEKLLKTSLILSETAWGNYAMAVKCKKVGDREAETRYMLKAYDLRKGDICLMKEVFRCLFENEKSKETIHIFESESEKIQENKRCLLYYAYALARTGRVEEAEEILCGKDGKTYLVVPDTRECELTETELWFYIQERKGKSRAEAGEPPRDLDFRMFSKREGWF